MFFRDLKPKPGIKLDVTLAEVHLPVCLGHRDAARTFVAPLSQQLAAAALGTVTGFRARRQEDDAIRGLDIHLGLTDASRPALKTVAGMLEYLCAPIGSSIRLLEGIPDPLLFGVTEGLELSIGSDAAPDAEARKALVQRCGDAIRDQAVSRGWARRADRTLFYFYGENFSQMKDKLTKVLDDDPRYSTAVLRRMA